MTALRGYLEGSRGGRLPLLLVLSRIDCDKPTFGERRWISCSTRYAAARRDAVSDLAECSADLSGQAQESTSSVDSASVQAADEREAAGAGSVEDPAPPSAIEQPAAGGGVMPVSPPDKGADGAKPALVEARAESGRAARPAYPAGLGGATTPPVAIHAGAPDGAGNVGLSATGEGGAAAPSEPHPVVEDVAGNGERSKRSGPSRSHRQAKRASQGDVGRESAPTAEGSTRNARFYVYGEGAVTHGDDACPEGIGLHHPTIERVEWPSRLAYYRNRMAIHWEGRWMRWVARSGYFQRQREVGITRQYMATIPQRWLDRLAFSVLGEPFPIRPRVYVPLRPEDSIYPGAVEEAARWIEIRAETLRKGADA